MQKFIQGADNSIFEVEYGCRQTSLFFLLCILKHRKGAFYAYEQTNVIYANKFSKPKTNNRINASCNFYCYLNALNLIKNIFCIKF